MTGGKPRCVHEFLGSDITCKKCGWVIPIEFPSWYVHRPRLALVPELPTPAYTVTVPCISCETLAEHDADAPILGRTADELIAFIREKLAEDQDASRRSFYNAQSLLFQIAQAVDAFPVSGGR